MRTRLTISTADRPRVQETRWQFRTYNATQMRALLRQAPELRPVACYDFSYDPESPRRLDDSYSDFLLILRRL